ncbi:MAG: ParB/RepB/Spo0J family partition protein [Bacteroidales bacterium]|jgi:ParB family chromosome partitioning protein|nr:ParB/RepB/Spo0J family partition protein [Bacteroidales bacterium]
MSENRDKKKVLGRGLSALIGGTEEVVPQDSPSRIQTGKIDEIEIDAIETNPWQPRTEFEILALEELSESIKTHGLIQPITVRLIENNKYQLISGERRLRASKAAGLKKIPAYIRSANDTQMIEMALVENIQREDLNDIEVALSYQRLIEECNMTQDQLSNRVGKNRSTITNYLRVLKLPQEVQRAISEKAITMGHAKMIAGIELEEQQIEVSRKIIEQGLSVRETEKLVKGLNKTTIKKVKTRLPEAYQATAKEFSQKIDAPIKIKRDISGKGNITISFSSDEDFQRILKLINK